jgi:hypothetical protein
MLFQVYKVTSNENGLVGYEIYFGQTWFSAFNPKQGKIPMEGLRVGRFTPNLTEKLSYEVVYDAPTEE